MSSVIPIWRCFGSLPSDSEAASLSAYCSFSLSTLEIACNPDTMSFALIEREHAAAWRWAILDADGTILEEGLQPSQTEAKRIAAGVLFVAVA